MSSLCEDTVLFEGTTFLKKMLELTKMSAEPNAQSKPIAFDSDMSELQARITPMVSGRRERYVFAEYRTPNSRAYAATVKRGDSAYTNISE